MEVDALRVDERNLLRFIRDRGPMTLRQIKRQYKIHASKRDRISDDLTRFGLVTFYGNAQGWTVVHATPKSAPLRL
jgi:hypothetical protein